jgi:hypothetical protein
MRRHLPRRGSSPVSLGQTDRPAAREAFASSEVPLLLEGRHYRDFNAATRYTASLDLLLGDPRGPEESSDLVLNLGNPMSAYFSLGHLLILLFSAALVFGLPLLVVFVFVRWHDQRHNRDQGNALLHHGREATGF